jgi:hypothetical protein
LASLVAVGFKKTRGEGTILAWLGTILKTFLTNPHALAGTTKHETLAKLKEWS